jgi:hypothetical protein
MKLRSTIFILLLIVTGACAVHDEPIITPSSENKITIQSMDRLPDEIEGCGCYLSRNDAEFESQSHLFASSSDTSCFMMINNELVRFRATNGEPFIFTKPNLYENFTSENYDLLIASDFEDSIRYDSWIFRGVLYLKDHFGKLEKLEFVGACGC